MVQTFYKIVEKVFGVKWVYCEYCGARIRCPEHGVTYIVKDYDSYGFPFYYCDKCVEEYHTALGALMHDHILDILAGVEEYLSPGCRVKVKKRRWWWRNNKKAVIEVEDDGFKNSR